MPVVSGENTRTDIPAGSGEAAVLPPEPVIADLRTCEQTEAAAELLWTVWGARSTAARSEVISASSLRALAHTGNYVAGAYRDGRLVGCTAGFFGADAGRPDYLHSHISGVARSEQNKGVGFALRRHQRDWALKRGIGTIRWTFDPLVRRNAYFNLCKLGAMVTGYEPSFYGRLDDGINTGESTDRLLVEWALDSEQIELAMAGDPVWTGERCRDADGARLIAVPRDVVLLRKTEPQRAHRLRDSVREQFLGLLGDGYQVVGMARDGNYVLLPRDAAVPGQP